MKTVLVFSHLRWNFVFQRPQHLLSRLAEHYSIIFVEEPLHTETRPFLCSDVVAPNVAVVVPHTNEKCWGFNDAQIEVIGPMLVQWLQKRNVHDHGIWFYTPQALPFHAFFKPKLVIFDIMDELSNFFGAPPEIKTRESYLLALADVVIAGGPSLHRAKVKARRDTILLPSAVDAEHFSPERAAKVKAKLWKEGKLPQLDIPHPRLGFFGVIDERLNIDLIAAVADADPMWHVIMVGPVVKIDPAILPQRPNIHWLGQQDYEVLPVLVQSWDVCLLPFALNDSTRFISPTKTLEYMAAEKPIVSTSIPDVIELYGDVVEIADTPISYIAAIQRLLHEDKVKRAERIQKSLKIVNKSSWCKATEVVREAIKAALGNAEPS